jgi:hypothetical protein
LKKNKLNIYREYKIYFIILSQQSLSPRQEAGPSQTTNKNKNTQLYYGASLQDTFSEFFVVDLFRGECLISLAGFREERKQELSDIS